LLGIYEDNVYKMKKDILEKLVFTFLITGLMSLVLSTFFVIFSTSKELISEEIPTSLHQPILFPVIFAVFMLSSLALIGLDYIMEVFKKNKLKGDKQK